MNFDRRKFLRCSIQTALGGVALSSAFGNLKAIAAAVTSAPQLSPTLGRCWGPTLAQFQAGTHPSGNLGFMV